MLTVKELKEILNNVSDDAQIFIRSDYDKGTSEPLCQIELSKILNGSREENYIIFNTTSSKIFIEDTKNTKIINF